MTTAVVKIFSMASAALPLLVQAETGKTENTTSNIRHRAFSQGDARYDLAQLDKFNHVDYFTYEPDAANIKQVKVGSQVNVSGLVGDWAQYNGFPGVVQKQTKDKKSGSTIWIVKLNTERELDRTWDMPVTGVDLAKEQVHVGSRVRVWDIKQEYATRNGSYGVVKEWDQEKREWIVTLDQDRGVPVAFPNTEEKSERSFSAPPATLTLASEQFQSGSRVELWEAGKNTGVGTIWSADKKTAHLEFPV